MPALSKTGRSPLALWRSGAEKRVRAILLKNVAGNYSSTSFSPLLESPRTKAHLHTGPAQPSPLSHPRGPQPLSPAQNGRHQRRGCEAPPTPAPRPAAGAAAGRGGLRAPPAAILAEEASPCRPGARVAGQRRGPARRRGRGGRRRDRLLAGELLHIAGALRSLRAGAVVPHQALRQVQGPGSIPVPLSPLPFHPCFPLLAPPSLFAPRTRARRCSELARVCRCSAHAH